MARFQASHLTALELQATQASEREWDSLLTAVRQFEEAGNAFTLLDLHAGMWRPLFCGGALERHPGYATLWGMFSVHKPRVPVQLTRGVRTFVAGLPHRRVDAMVAAWNVPALGWARLIGLREECLLRAVNPDGSDMVVFVRPFAPAPAGEGS